eukprot:scaffold124918_cov36-Phaeocystis_antarctica.AAC.1
MSLMNTVYTKFPWLEEYKQELMNTYEKPRVLGYSLAELLAWLLAPLSLLSIADIVTDLVTLDIYWGACWYRAFAIALVVFLVNLRFSAVFACVHPKPTLLVGLYIPFAAFPMMASGWFLEAQKQTDEDVKQRQELEMKYATKGTSFDTAEVNIDINGSSELCYSPQEKVLKVLAFGR